MTNPIGSPRLQDMVKGKKNIVIIASDHTRPVPSRETVLANHCAEFIAHPRARTGILEGNPTATVTAIPDGISLMVTEE